MSRSVKKVAGYSDGEGTRRKRFAKRDANRKVRQSHLHANGGFYKKLYPQYDICDFNIRYWNIREEEEYINNKYSVKEAARQRHYMFSK
jgi:hypothetical protein